jgi:hypothetical protein
MTSPPTGMQTDLRLQYYRAKYCGLLSTHRNCPLSHASVLTSGNVYLGYWCSKILILLPDNHILLPDDHILLPDDHILLPDNHVLLPDNHVLLSDNHILLPDNHILLSNNHILLPDNHISFTFAWNDPINQQPDTG